MHGGAKGSGGQKGEANGAYRHGGFTAESVQLRRDTSALVRTIRNGGADDAEPDDLAILEALRALLGIKLTREDKRHRNKARWAAGDRRPWGGEDRRHWPKWGRGRRKRVSH